MSLQSRLEALVAAIGADVKALNAPLATTYTFAAALTTYPDQKAHSGYVTTGNGWPINGFLSGFRNGTVGVQRVQDASSGATWSRYWTGAAWTAFTLYVDSQDFDAKGDLLLGTGPDSYSIRAVGANGTVLTADSTDPTGVKWATPAGGGQTSTVYKKTADQSLTAVGPAGNVAIADLAFPIAASARAEFEFMLAITSAAVTTGFSFGITAPSPLTTFLAVQEYQSSATAWTTATIQGPGNFTLVTASYVAAPSGIAMRIKGIIQNSFTAGTVQLVGGTEVLNSAIVVRAGSTLKVA